MASGGSTRSLAEPDPIRPQRSAVSDCVAVPLHEIPVEGFGDEGSAVGSRDCLQWDYFADTVADVRNSALQTVFAAGCNPSHHLQTEAFAVKHLHTFTMRVCAREAAAGEVWEPLCCSRSCHELGELPPVGRDLLD
jgi:hypothetical protein